MNAQGQNSRTYNLAQNPSVHMEIEHILSVAGEFCFTVSCNGQNFVQKFTPTGVTLIPVRQDIALCQEGTTTVNCMQVGHTSSLSQHKLSYQFVCFSAKAATSTHAAKDVAQQHVVKRLKVNK